MLSSDQSLRTVQVALLLSSFGEAVVKSAYFVYSNLYCISLPFPPLTSETVSVDFWSPPPVRNSFVDALKLNFSALYLISKVDEAFIVYSLLFLSRTIRR